MSTFDLLQRKKSEIEAVALHYGARNIRVFGSTARGDDTPRSDIDMLADLDPGMSLLDHIGLEQALSDLLGKKTEVVSAKNLEPLIKKKILAEARPL
jgi:hypothetical protein